MRERPPFLDFLDDFFWRRRLERRPPPPGDLGSVEAAAEGTHSFFLIASCSACVIPLIEPINIFAASDKSPSVTSTGATGGAAGCSTACCSTVGCSTVGSSPSPATASDILFSSSLIHILNILFFQY